MVQISFFQPHDCSLQHLVGGAANSLQEILKWRIGGGVLVCKAGGRQQRKPMDAKLLSQELFCETPDPPLPGILRVSYSVFRRYNYYSSDKTIKEELMLFRGVGIRTHLEWVRNESSSIREETGSANGTDDLPIFPLQDNGDYEINADYPEMVVTESWVTRSTLKFCPNSLPESVNAKKRESTHQRGKITVRGRINPKFPNVYKGSETSGDLEKGMYIITWDLQLIKKKK